MNEPTDTRLYALLRESLMIEGINREPTVAEVAATLEFFSWKAVGVGEVTRLVKVYQPDAILRTSSNLNVRVGNYVAPRGGPHIGEMLGDILADANCDQDPWLVHVAYETLHPFTDGNGRSGRTLWARQMMRLYGALPRISFLHWAYYQALAHAPERQLGVPCPTS